MNESFELFGLTIHWYGVILTFAMVVALVLFIFLGKKRKVSSDFAMSMFLFAIIFAIVGARLFYVIPRAEYWESWSSFLRVFAISEGGLTIIGAIPIGAIGIMLCCKIYGKSPFRILDIVVPCMLLGQVIGRWGNFVNSELYGIPVIQEWLKFFPMAVNINGVWHYASFFYEMMLNLVGVIIALTVFFKVGEKLKTGVMTLGYLLWYAIVRACLEFVKEGAMQVGGIGIVQVIMFCIIPIALIFMVLTQKGKIKFETDKMYMRHFNLSYDPPEYVDKIDNITQAAVGKISSPTIEPKGNSKTIKSDKTLSSTNIERGNISSKGVNEKINSDKVDKGGEND